MKFCLHVPLAMVGMMIMALVAACGDSAVTTSKSAPPAASPDARTSAASSTAPRQAFSIAGSGSNLPVTQLLLDGFNATTGQALSLPPSIGSGGAVKAVQAGALTIGLVSRPLKKEELAAGLSETAYARVGVVLATHRDVPDNDISAADLVAIYRGERRTWSDGKTIFVLARENGDSSNQAISQAIPGFGAALQDSLGKKRWEIFYSDQEELDAILATNGGLGFADTTTIPYLAPRAKALSFGGVQANVANLANGSYPLVKDLRFVYRPPLPVEARAFLDFVASPRGQGLLRKNGALPLGTMQ